MEIEELKQELKKYLQETRYLHSIGVMNMCEKLAINYGVDVERVKKTGLMHDLAKEFTREEKLKYVHDNNLEMDEIEEIIVEILHGKIAADICKKKYKFDKEMCQAIEYHTTGKPNMTMLEKIVFIADKIDETRKNKGVEELRKLAFEDIDAAILKNINFTSINNIEKGSLITKKRLETRNYILINSKK